MVGGTEHQPVPCLQNDLNSSASLLACDLVPDEINRHPKLFLHLFSVIWSRRVWYRLSSVYGKSPTRTIESGEGPPEASPESRGKGFGVVTSDGLRASRPELDIPTAFDALRKSKSARRHDIPNPFCSAFTDAPQE